MRIIHIYIYIFTFMCTHLMHFEKNINNIKYSSTHTHTYIHTSEDDEERRKKAI